MPSVCSIWSVCDHERTIARWSSPAASSSAWRWRALVHAPYFLVADEPTGSLDTRTGRDIAALLRDIAHDQRVGLLIATHDTTVASAADRVLDLHDGMIAAR